MRRAYGFEEVAIVPGDVTVNPEQTNIDLKLGNLTFPVPILAAAMDAVVDPRFAVAFSKLGGLAVLNLEGVQARYEKPADVLAEIARATMNEAGPLIQKVYSQPIQERLVGERIREIKSNGGVCAVSVTPANTKKLVSTIVEAGADVLVVASTVTTARHVSKSLKGLVFSELCKTVSIPVVVGNAVSYSAALELM
jgi:IMP dehydrogenase